MKSLQQVIQDQAPCADKDEFICKFCHHWGGGVKCKANVFISTVGANTSKCQYFKK
jgi:hypothetical protein